MEEKRQKLVWLIFCVFLAIIFEGVLRKWVFPSYHHYFFFVRDPFVILAYFYALYANLAPKQGIIFYLVIFFTLAVSVFSFFQTLYSHLPWWIIAYSWRTHFLMLPLALLIGSFVTADDLKKLFRFTLRLTPAYVILVYFQSISPQDHWINAGALGLFNPVSATAGLVRTEGFFTSSVGNTLFVGLIFAILLSIWLMESWSDVVGSKEKIIYTILSTAILVVSGQRSSFLLVGLIFAAGLFAAIIVGRNMLIKFLKPALLLVSLSALLLIFVFPRHLDAISNRFIVSSPEGALGYDLVERTLYDMSAFYKELFGKIPAMGLGIGYSSNAAYVFNITVIDIVSENEWGRHIIELGPFFGLLTIVFRIFMFLYLLFLCSGVCFNQKNPMPIIFFAVLGVFLLMGQLTGNGIASGFTWFYTGIVLALFNQSATRLNRDENLHTQLSV